MARMPRTTGLWYGMHDTTAESATSEAFARNGERVMSPYAASAGTSRGRRFPEPEHGFRTPYQRDRDRIIHSRAFRRLEGKTQVFLNGTGDHYRTRLTHTIEVAALARTVSRGLGLNEDLAEAIALGHDLGHTPFGHMGERVLNELLAGTALRGFDHNQQALRVVDVLERKYPGIDGLNLTWEVRAGLLKHRTPDTTLDGVRIGTVLSCEAQAAHVADDVAYCTHDLDDGLESGLLTEAALAGVALWERARAAALAQGGRPEAESFQVFVIRCLIDLLVGDLIETSRAPLAAVAPAMASPGPDAGGAAPGTPTIGFSAAIAVQAEELRGVLFQRVYRHPDVMAVNQRMAGVVRDLFAHLRAHPDQLGESAQQRMLSEGLDRAVTDYIAGMTDHYALRLHETLCRGAALPPQ